MKFYYIVIVFLLLAAMAISGCTSPGATPSLPPSPSPAPSPTATPTATPAPTVTPTTAPTATPGPSPTPVPEYTNGSPISVSHIRVDWDTMQYEGLAKETVSMTVKNTLNDSVVLDVLIQYQVSTPATFANPDGSYENRTYTVKADPQNIGLMQSGEQRDLTFHVDHAKNVPATIAVTVHWRGGSAVAFTRTLDLPDHSFGTYEF